jgi:hypothetical protein
MVLAGKISIDFNSIALYMKDVTVYTYNESVLLSFVV